MIEVRNGKTKPVFFVNNKRTTYSDGLRMVRREYGLTRGMLAEIIGVDKRSLANNELGLRSPSKPSMMLLKNYLEKGVDK